MNDIDASYAECQRLARAAASNFYFSFLLLPREKRRSMCALYAYLRYVDDLADNEDAELPQRREQLSKLRAEVIGRTFRAEIHPTLPALGDTVHRFGIPIDYLVAAIEGVEMDLSDTKFKTFRDLELYCYRVASVVGLACIHIWGFEGPTAFEPARRCGIAFQLTNILRDLAEDARRGRCYLPEEDLLRSGYSLEQIQQREANAAFFELMTIEIERAEYYFAAVDELRPQIASDGRGAFAAMAAIYQTLLRKIKRDPAAVLAKRIRVGRWQKLLVAAKAMMS